MITNISFMSFFEVVDRKISQLICYLYSRFFVVSTEMPKIFLVKYDCKNYYVWIVGYNQPCLLKLSMQFMNINKFMYVFSPISKINQ